MLEMFQNHPVVKKMQEVGGHIDEAADQAMNRLREGMEFYKKSRWNRFLNSTTGRVLIVAGLSAEAAAGAGLYAHKASEARASREETTETAKVNSEEVFIHFEGAPDWMADQEVEKSIHEEADALRTQLVSAGEKDVVVSVTFSHGDLVVAEGVDELPNKMSVHIFSDRGGMDCEEFFSNPMTKEQIHEVLQGRTNEMPYIAPGQASSLIGDDLSELGHHLFSSVAIMVDEEIKSHKR